MFIVIAGIPGHDSTGLLRLQYSAHKDVSFFSYIDGGYVKSWLSR